MSVYRPELHVTAERGILEGPAGVIRAGERGERVWHMFYQYKLTPDSPSAWGHDMSEQDPFSWLECNDALVAIGGELNVRAGAVVATDDGADLYFTSNTSAGDTVQRAHADDLAALCEELEESETGELLPSAGVKRLGAVVQDTEVDGQVYTNFRSPCVVPDWEEDDNRERGHDGWLMLAVTGSLKAPVPVVLSSHDGQSWLVDGALTFDGDPGLDVTKPLVAPRISRLRDEVDGEIYDVLFLTAEIDGKDRTVYLVGVLKGSVFTVTSQAKPLDYGHDFTRPRNSAYTLEPSNAEDRYERTYLFGFMTDSGRHGDPTKEPNWESEGWANTLTLPRRATLQHGQLYQVPAGGLPEAVQSSRHALMWTALCDIPAGSSVEAEVLDGNGEPVAVITHNGETLNVDRLDGNPAVAEIHDDDEDNITVIVDGSTLEVYAGGGSVVTASRIWSATGYSGIRSRAAGDAEIYNEWRRGFPSAR
ncbi:MULTISPECIES: GH32 C-terminal domain-containing protein [Corynebacterium]|uniref:Beta-fructosidase n=1 Tax=Corynebacterium hadale TaxID=2026255 RepID=A0A269PE96_9CORY|nr:GH32 C-terminal domain-containing protein [Corynebacterium hadale]PAJ70436.1 beta-fructosidase [Corynebacterium hadale]WKC59847.1 hypothetical protein CHAD_04815 [Corynebacterium hadale]